MRRKHEKIIVIMGSEYVHIILVLIGFSERRVFSQVSFCEVQQKTSKKKQRLKRLPYAKNSGNPCTKLIFSLFLFLSVFLVFCKSLKNDDFRSPFGSAPVAVLTISLNYADMYEVFSGI